MTKLYFNIMSYNVFCRESKLFKDSQNARCKLIPKTIDEYSQNIDCIIVQEIFDEDAEKILNQQMKKYGFKYKSNKLSSHIIKNYYFFTKKIIEDGGVKIYSKFPIIFEKHLIFKHSSGEDELAGKGVCYIKIQKYNKYIHIFGTHLQSGKTDEKIKIKFKQIQQFKDFFNKQKIDPQDLVIFGGDFNINLKTQYKLLENIEDILNFYLIDHSEFIPQRNDLQLRDNSEPNKKQNILDHFFISKQHFIPEKAISNIIELKSTIPYKIRKPKKKSNNFFIKNTILSKLNKYSKKKYKLYSLSNHEPLISFFTLN